MTKNRYKKLRHIVIIAIVLIASLALTSIAGAAGKTISDYDKAVNLYNKGKYEQAIPLFKSTLASDPKPETYFMLGYSLYKIGKHEESRQYFQQSYQENPEFSPTPKLEQKLNRRLDVARPAPGDVKTAVPKGTLPPEVLGLDPSEYMIIDNSSRLTLPDGQIKSTDDFEPVKRPKKPAVVGKTTAKTTTQTKPTETTTTPMPDAAPATVANTAAPVEVVAKEGAPKVEEKAPAPRKRARARTSKPPKPKGFVEQTLDTVKSFVPKGMNFVTIGIIAGGVIIYLILTILMVKKVKNNDLKKAFIALAILPVIQLAIIILAKRSGGAPAPAAEAGGGDMADLSGEPNLDLPDVDDMGFDMDDDFGDAPDDFATDSGFGSDEGIGAETDDFATEDESGSDGLEVDQFGEDDADAEGGDDFNMDSDDGDEFDENSSF